MAVITISRGCFSHGREIAEKVAERLGYECVSREVLIEAAKFFNIPEMSLVKSMEDAPGILERITHGRSDYLTYVRAALLERASSGRLVYHGLGGRLLLGDLPCLLSVRIIADMNERIAFLQTKENKTREEAFRHLRAEDRVRYDWSRYLYNEDINDPSLYDLVIHIGKLKIDDACDVICRAAESERYNDNEECRTVMTDLAISSHIQALLLNTYDADVTCKNGYVYIKVAAPKIRKAGYSEAKTEKILRETMREEIIREIESAAHSVPGVKEVACDIDMPYYR